MAEHDRKKAKAAKRAVATQDRGKVAIEDQDTMDEEKLETQPLAVLVAKKSKIIKNADFVKPRKVVATKKPTAGASGSQRRKKYLA